MSDNRIVVAFIVALVGLAFFVGGFVLASPWKWAEPWGAIGSVAWGLLMFGFLLWWIAWSGERVE